MRNIKSMLARGALPLAALCLAATSAEAVQYSVTYTGVVNSGYDNFNFFGQGTNLTGQSATIQYFVDTARAGPGSGDRAVVSGSSGNPYSLDLQPIYVVVTIGFTTKTFDYPTPQSPGVSGLGFYNNSDRTGLSAGGGRSTFYNERYVAPGTSYPGRDSYVSASVTLGAAGVGSNFFERLISEPFSLALTSATGFAYGQASFGFNTYTPLGQIADRQVGGNVTLNRITVAPVTTAVPEPVTWAMLTGGFGLIGGLARRQRVSVRINAPATA